MAWSFRIKKLGGKNIHTWLKNRLRLQSGPVGVVPDFASPGPDIPAFREQLAVLVSTGKAKEAIGVELTCEQVKRLSDKDVEKYYKRYEAFVGAKKTDSLIDSFIFLASKVAGMAVDIKDIDAYQKELKNDYIINKELSNLAGSLALKCGRFLALANSALNTTKHIDFAERTAEPKAKEIHEQCTTIVSNFSSTSSCLIKIKSNICINIKSTEQQPDTPAAETPAADITQQVTSPTPTTWPAKNPKRVAAGKLIAERVKQAREAQKKAAAEAAVIIENNKAQQTEKGPAAPSPATEGNTISSSSLSTTLWLAVGSIVVSLVGIYYKREELKAF